MLIPTTTLDYQVALVTGASRGISSAIALALARPGARVVVTGAVYGQLAGAYWGESGIPAEWLEGLGRRDMIERALIGLLKSPPNCKTLAGRCDEQENGKLLRPGGPFPIGRAWRDGLRGRCG